MQEMHLTKVMSEGNAYEKISGDWPNGTILSSLIKIAHWINKLVLF